MLVAYLLSGGGLVLALEPGPSAVWARRFAPLAVFVASLPVVWAASLQAAYTAALGSGADLHAALVRVGTVHTELLTYYRDEWVAIALGFAAVGAWRLGGWGMRLLGGLTWWVGPAALLPNHTPAVFYVALWGPLVLLATAAAVDALDRRLWPPPPEEASGTVTGRGARRPPPSGAAPRRAGPCGRRRRSRAGSRRSRSDREPES